MWLIARLPAISIVIASSAAPQQCTLSSRVREALVTVQPPMPLREHVPPPPPPPSLPPIDTLPTVPDEIVVHALDHGRAAFHGCFVRAQRADPTFETTKVVLHVVLAADGRVLGVDAEINKRRFAACLIGVAKRLAFPAPGRTAVANIAFVAS